MIFIFVALDKVSEHITFHLLPVNATAFFIIWGHPVGSYEVSLLFDPLQPIQTIVKTWWVAQRGEQGNAQLP